ncbi:MAG: exodeoxyribonuclease V subunit alpha [Methylococcaceae bacterium]|nr:exodeoxyribonuclease V subunit alpha [Methylococcaceae bacterium]MDZ4157791.1 exodeoxyribonuclease V subunit alpha [Methylococcales bacterium]MDP2392135.1 exodeoxyribonuclease V subunit alpha [Methylococcaceae bacterium]MDP3020813.1 exodeoxyribonuclease V subunit alpha [Methylococcaceae bacterium]MDP3391631.1 exodeoxyribonuclease V subunit alpha [Methylococcaceae bacterium]
MTVLEHVDNWIGLGWLSHLDRAFMRFLQDQEPDVDDLVLWAGALVSLQLGRGEVFLDLEKLCRQPGLTLALPNEDDAEQFEHDESFAVLPKHQLENWQSMLSQSSLVGLADGNTPLVLDGKRLYLRRYWQYQQILDQAIQQRLQPIRNTLSAAVQDDIKALFPESKEHPDWQKIACVLALRARFSIITGGPGTGKTTTLTKLLALLIKLANDETSPAHKLNILLAAPTGKAAARVSESISKALDRLEVSDAIKQLIPQKASTLHRLLGSRHDSRRYLHDRNNPLVADIVIVDEASMIDLEMMASLLDALADSTQLILLGDKDQLASVEAGSVMGDLCHGAENAAYDEQTRAWINPYLAQKLDQPVSTGSAINQQTVMLRYSHRFGEHSGIGQLAKAVNHGDASSANDILSDSITYQDLKHLVLSDVADRRLKQLITHSDKKNSNRRGYDYYRDVIKQRPQVTVRPNSFDRAQESPVEGPDHSSPNDATQYNHWAKHVLDAFDTFQVLCALRRGPWGVEGLNQRIEQWLFADKLPALWYEGRPVMITRNDYNLGLMNGDVGITLKDSTGKLRVAFPSENSGDTVNIRWVSPMRLPDVETAFAITVHKSQGSEFNHVALVLPETKTPVLTRELIYTGITRAKDNFTLLESRAEIFNQAIEATCK